MDGREFVGAIKRYVRDEAIVNNLKLFSAPPGRAPRTELVQLSKWYNALDEYGKEMVRQVVKESVDARSVFAPLCA